MLIVKKIIFEDYEKPHVAFWFSIHLPIDRCSNRKY